jgi:hypothetical protein
LNESALLSTIIVPVDRVVFTTFLVLRLVGNAAKRDTFACFAIFGVFASPDLSALFTAIIKPVNSFADTAFFCLRLCGLATRLGTGAGGRVAGFAVSTGSLWLPLWTDIGGSFGTEVRLSAFTLSGVELTSAHTGDGFRTTGGLAIDHLAGFAGKTGFGHRLKATRGFELFAEVDGALVRAATAFTRCTLSTILIGTAGEHP